MENRTQTKNRAMPRRKTCAVDLFCGVGGLTYGLAKAGVDVRLGVDIDPACEHPYTANNSAKFLLKSVEKLEASEPECHTERTGSNSWPVALRVKPFPPTPRRRPNQTNAGGSCWNFRDSWASCRRVWVTMENVPQLVIQNVFDEFVSNLEANGYTVKPKVVNCAEYGVLNGAIAWYCWRPNSARSHFSPHSNLAVNR